MNSLHSWKTATIAVIAMSITGIPSLLTLAPVHAQYNLNQRRSITIPINVTLPVSYEKEKIVLSPGENLKLTLTIPSDIVDRSNYILIPANTKVVGQLQSVELQNTNPSDKNKKGVRFVAEKLILPSNQEVPINAASKTITTTESIRKGASTSQILTGAAVGGGAASLLALVTGNRKIEILEPIAGAAVGALGSAVFQKQKVDVFVLRPKDDLPITLNAPLVLSRN